MTLNFEWDEQKAEANIKKHGVSFEEAETVFDEPFSITLDDLLHPYEEDRFLTIGYSEEQRLLVVVHRDRGDNIRIISARPVTNSERRIYERII
ncbi:BrnT family toxin [Argonema galeatum]|uniref:BrnT family toxin n=1 Tax=Argonema galeatum TaxID=2942762 RepID=UPI002011143A|nr:BrnT family toxin [Argonema galeatum]MCL1468095.1 BrnT family toxin [Argonema galeatum A003/A1]